MLGNTVLLSAGIIAIIIFSFALLILKFYQKVPPGRAMIVTGIRGVDVHFSAIIVIPILERIDLVDITIKKLELSCIGNAALICKDGREIDIKSSFFIMINPNKEEVKIAASKIGSETTFDLKKLKTLFIPRFLESLKLVVESLDSNEILSCKEQFRMALFNHINSRMSTYVLDDCSIDYLNLNN